MRAYAGGATAARADGRSSAVLADNFATLAHTETRIHWYPGVQCVGNSTFRLDMPTHKVGRPTEHDKHGLREFIVSQMRLRGFLVPQQMRALRRLRPARGWPVATEAHVGARDPLAKRVCRLVRARAVEICLFGNLSPVCHARDTFVLHGDAQAHGTGNAHRDCPDSSDHYQYQFIAVLQGQMTIFIERRVTGSPQDMCRYRVTPIIIPANHVLFFFGSRYAHAAQCDDKCKRVAGWVSATGKGVIEDSGGDIEGWF
jgi:hypothetical protein